ncbi:helix-turn-helix domain-containing protein [Gordonia desulfuricans]|uniref:helix-turn-helix domain-containing protein n=1 Tax=Gordonia desulfuricans TaxID=89051 RepID=UPI00073EDE35|nr:helix-turn-helix domain-containing protein [Gordonia desulfuricans]
MPSSDHSVTDDLRVFRKAEVAERLAISEDTVDRLIAAGDLHTVRPRRRGVVVQIPARSLREYIYGRGGH